MTTPLHDLTVIDFSKFLPGPYCTWMLGDLGADVIRIENPRELAKQRKVFGWDKLSDEDNAVLRAHDIFARNKRSILLDPGHETAREAIIELIRRADILVEDYRPGVMAAMGYDWDTLKAINPSLIYCSITLCGQTGPCATKPGHDPIALALSGALSRIGEHPSQPSFPGVPVADLLSGSNAVIGILAAVHARASTGQGQRVDIAMSDASLALIANVVSRNPDLSKAPARGMPRADSGIWQTADGAFLVTTDMEPRYWQRFCDAIGRPDLAARQMDREHWPEIKADIASIILGHPLSHWLEILEAADTQYAAVLSIDEALNHPHNRARQMVPEITLASGYSLKHTGCPIHLSHTPAKAPEPAKPAGSDTQSILSALGYSQRHIDLLLEDAQ